MPIISSISAVQVTEALKILTGNYGNSGALHGCLMQIDIWQNDWRKIKLKAPREDCPACRQKYFEFLDAKGQDFAATLCGRDAVQVAPPIAVQINLEELAARLGKLGEVKQNEYLVRFKNGEYELTVFRDARAIIRGTDDPATARSLYAKYVGT
jgi:adenylyltransferase/sulfurtransferase